jgi:RNA polymerase sigma-70 factor (ECF subfamily)
MRASGHGDSEAALRDAVLAGDQAAWRRLYDGAFARLWAYVVWRCAGDRHVAEEITQETWLVAVRRIRDFEPGQSPFQAWLRGIAAKVLQNHFRTLRRRPELVQALPETAVTSGEEQHAQAELIARSLAELPESHEGVLRAKYLDLLSVEEIAAEWRQSPKAIESLLSRARQGFRAAYEKLAEDWLISKESKS